MSYPEPRYLGEISATFRTPDSSQFGPTVAEFWFRSTAERVGFRPVGWCVPAYQLNLRGP